MIRGTNINSGIPQYKNCQKWRNITFIYYIYGSKCQKCNSLHKLKNHREIVWCCKANFKTDSSRLEMKKEESCTHFFKYINRKGNYQIDNNNCLFWKHRCYNSRLLGLDNEVTLYRIYTRELDGTRYRVVYLYILDPHGLCQLFLTHSKQPCVRHEISIWYDVILLELSLYHMTPAISNLSYMLKIE